MLSRYLALAILAITAYAPLAHASEEGHADFWRQARISIDVDGKVTALKFVNWKAKKDVVGEKLAPIIRSWVFEPGRVNGLPAPTETTLTLRMDMQKVSNENYAITMLSADTGPAWEAIKPPEYPMLQLKYSIEAEIVVLVDYGADGRIEKMAVEEALSNGSKSDVQAFVNAIDKEVKSNWRFHPEVVDGHGIAGVVRVPVEFCTDESGSKCELMSKRLKQRLAERGESILSKLPVALNSQTKLLTQVVGTTL